MQHLYTDYERYVCDWTGNLIGRGQLPAGEVWCRPIQEIQPNELKAYTQAHFFNGIGGWPLALRLAGWPQDREVWTGSCPCQPFSGAGDRKGALDARHVWPSWFALIEECRPSVIFGEQVASPDGRAWFAAVQADLEALGYAVGAADLCAAGIGAPHIRQRLFWVAHADSEAQSRRRVQGPTEGAGPGAGAALERPARLREDRGMADGHDDGRQGSRIHLQQRGQGAAVPQPGGTGEDCWSEAELIPCADGIHRPIEPSILPLADGVPGRLGQIRAYGNSIVPQVAATFVRAFLEAEAS